LSIFRAYDIRGIYGKDLTEEIARKIGQAFAQYLQDLLPAPFRRGGAGGGVKQEERLRILVGRDNRPHGIPLQHAFIQGLLEAGVCVDKLEDSTTPMVYFAVHQGDYDGGVSVTASHNPAEYNGFKLVGREAHSICGEELKKIEALLAPSSSLEPLCQQQSGSTQSMEPAISSVGMTNIEQTYRSTITSRIQLKRPLSVVVDAGNGIAGKYYPAVLRALGCTVHELFCEQNGTFPNHEPDPVVEKNTEDLMKKVLELKADLGIAFDGDGDRLAMVDELGHYHDANETFVLLIRDLLERRRGEKIIHTVSSSLVVTEEIKRLNGIPVMVPVGHSFVEEAMRKERALLGGEQSGHFFLAEDYFGFDDACFTAAKLLQIFSGSDQPVSNHYASIPKYFSLPEMRPYCPDEKKFEIVKNISKKLVHNMVQDPPQADRGGLNQQTVNTMDGVRVDFEDGWLGIRASNTSPCLSVIVEGKSEETRKKMEVQSKKLLDFFL